MSLHSSETIAAIATPIGIGGISVIRISGPESFSAVDSLFRGSAKLSRTSSHTIHYGLIVDPVSRETVDNVLVSVFHNPSSYTGEDVVEISSHGGYFVAQKILKLILKLGIRLADPGEFTLRAFLNAKLDLVQAEAVADLIHSKTEKAHKASVDQLSGKLSAVIQQLRSSIVNLSSLLELELDFSQEGIELTEKKAANEKLYNIESTINQILKSYEEGKVIKEGIRVVLVGRPNVGKSSLMNVLLQEERSIVSEMPGTTRDTIEETILLDGVEFIFNDTAGLRDSLDKIEQEGIRRTNKAIEDSDVIILLLDGSLDLTDSETTVYSQISEQYAGSKSLLWVMNKSDIKINKSDAKSLIPNPIWISCKSHDGIIHLKERLIGAAIPQHDSSVSSVIITNGRHKDALEKALSSIKSARVSIENGLSGEFAALDLRAALNYLGEVIGLTTPDDILNNIFSNFCIGK